MMDRRTEVPMDLLTKIIMRFWMPVTYRRKRYQKAAKKKRVLKKWYKRFQIMELPPEKEEKLRNSIANDKLNPHFKFYTDCFSSHTFLYGGTND